MEASYTTNTRWKAYQGFVPSPYRIDEPPTEEWWDWRGMRVHLDRYASKTAKLKLIVLHGGGGYARLVSPYAVMARRADVETISPDLPGYGLTQTNGESVDYPTWVDCVCALVDAERARDDRPIVLFGGSMGGMLGYQVAAKKKAAGLIATCLLDIRDEQARRIGARLPVIADVVPKLLQVLPVDAVRIPMRWLINMRAISNIAELSEICESDPLGGGNSVPLRFIRTYLASSPPIEPEDFRICPVLLVHPGEDTWTPLALSQAFFDRLACEKELVVLEKCGHFPVESPGIEQMERAMQAFLKRLA